jgi:ADP-heptose:LPS heptosyltransferase
MVEARWREVRRLLTVRLDNLGDVLLATPAIHALKESIPGVSITLLASPVGAQVGALDPDIDDVIEYQAPWMDPWQRLPQDPAREMAMIARLHEGAFDGAVIFNSFRQSPLPAAYLCYLAGIPLRLAASIDGPGSLLTTRHRHPERMMHEVERGLDLVGAIGAASAEPELVLRVPEVARHTVGPLLSREPLIVIHPGCSMPARTYPWQLYAEVVDLLVERIPGLRVALTGTKEEVDLVERIMAELRPDTLDHVMPVAGRLSFAELCALIEGAELVLTNNTGPMHIAAALKTPVVVLFALTNPPEQWGPWRVAHRMLYHDVPCRICYSRVCPYDQECLTLVTAAQVVDACRSLLPVSLPPDIRRGAA